MGIREHFEKQLDDKDLKLQDLSLDVSETKEPEFDWEKLISDSEWRMLLQELKSDREHNPVSMISEFCASIKILFPDRSNELGLDNQMFEEEKEVLDRHLNRDKHIPSVAVEAQKAKILFPDRVQELPLKSYKKKMIRRLKEFRKENTDSSWHYFAPMAATFRILFPDDVDKLKLDNQVCEGIKSMLGKSRKSMLWSQFMELAANARILFPDSFEKFGLDDHDFKSMEKKVESLRKKNEYYFFVQGAANFKIISADEVKITDQGIELKMPEPKEDFKQEKKERPVRRKF